MPLHPISGTADKDSPAEQILERKESAMVEFNKMDYLINTFMISGAAKWIADADAYWEAKEKEESPDAL